MGVAVRGTSEGLEIFAASEHDHGRVDHGVPGLAHPRILVVEDHRLFADGLVEALREEGIDACAVIPEGPEDLVEAHRCAPHLVLLDLNLGSLGLGVQFIPRFAGQGVPLLVCTGETDRALLGECLVAGAVGVFDKSRPLVELLEMIERALRGAPVMSVRERLDLLDERRRRVVEAHERLAPFAALTPAEESVLAQLMEGEAADSIATAGAVSIWTVRSHIKAILQKLDVNSQLAATVLARRSGWQPSEDLGSRPCVVQRPW